MATIANIALQDSAAAAKTYVPERVQTGRYASWVNRDQGTTIGVKRLSLLTRETTGKSEKRQVKLTLPSVDVTTGLAKYTNSFTGEFQVDERSTLAEKQELVNSVAVAMGLAPVKANVSTGEAVSG